MLKAVRSRIPLHTAVPTRSPGWRAAALTAAAATGMLAAGGLLWRLVAGSPSPASPAQLASAAAASVADAAYRQVLATSDGAPGDRAGAVRLASAEAVAEAASAGADITSAAYGAMQGARELALEQPGEELAAAAAAGIREGALAVGPAARERVEDFLRALG